MPRLQLTTEVEQDYQTVFQGFTEDLFKKLKPPGVSMKLLQFGGCRKGDVVELEMKILGLIKQTWKSTVIDFEENESEIYFVDAGEGKDLPFFLKKWKHHHRIINNGQGGTTIIDDFEYRAPFGLNLLLRPILWMQFAYRKPIYRKVFKRLAAAKQG